MADFDVRERRLSLGEGSRKHFFVVDQRLTWTDAAALSLDQVSGPSRTLPLDRAPIGACEFRSDVQWAFDSKGFPERCNQSL